MRYEPELTGSAVLAPGAPLNCDGTYTAANLSQTYVDKNANT